MYFTLTEPLTKTSQLKSDSNSISDIPDVPQDKIGTKENPYWSMKNESVMGKFKFEVLGIGEIGADKPKSYSILLVEDKDGVEMLKEYILVVLTTMMLRRETS